MIRVVLIDDHEMIVQSVVRLLRDGPEIVVVGTALNATKGIEVSRLEQPDVIIIDYTLPDMDAPRAIRTLRSVCPEAKVITFSGSSALARCMSQCEQEVQRGSLRPERSRIFEVPYFE